MSFLNDLSLCRVTETKNTLLKHAEEGAQLTKDYDELVKKLNDLKISHQ